MAVLKLKLKPTAEEEEASPLPLSLSLPLPVPILPSRRAMVTKPRRLESNPSLLRHYYACIHFAVAANVIPPLIFWCVHCPQGNNVFAMLQSYLTALLIFKGIRSKGLKEKEKETQVVDWTKLPLELWGEIGQRLESHLDVIRSKSVCKQWQSSMPSTNRFPLLVPIPPYSSSDHNMPYFISEVNIYMYDVGSETEPKHVLVDFEELYQSSSFGIRCYFPCITKLDLLTMKPRDKHHRLSFAAKAYRIHFAKRCEGDWKTRCSSVTKTILISPNANAVDHASYAPTIDDISVVALFGQVGKLGVLRLGGSQDPNWDWETDFCTHVIHDIAACKGQLYAIDRRGTTFLMDYDSLQMTQVAVVADLPDNLHSMQLFEAHGELYVATYVRLDEAKFELDVRVFKLSIRFGKWVEVDDTGNQLFLRGTGYNVCIPRDIVTSDKGKWMMEFKRDCAIPNGPFESVYLMLPQAHMDDESSHRFIRFYVIYSPWFLDDIAPTALAMTTTSSILSPYDNNVVRRNNALHRLSRPSSLH